MVTASNSAEYRITVSGYNATTFAPASPSYVIKAPKNVGWSDYLNDVPEAFFTLLQDDPIIPSLRDLLGRGHVRIARRDLPTGEWANVFGGWFGTEVDERKDDLVFYAHGYLSSLWYLHTDWDQKWTTAHLGTIASDVWTRAKTTIASSPLAWAATGLIQAPATTSGGATPIILPTYETYYKRILFVLRDLSEIGRSDTTNAVVFQISPGGTFNFYGARGSDRDVTYRYPDAIVDFNVMRTPFDRRNQVLAVGMSPRELVLRTEQSAAVTGYGRRQEALLLQWVRDQTELERVAKLRLTKANREFLTMNLLFLPGAVIPPGHSFSPFTLADRINIKISKGLTNIDQRVLVSGVQVLYMDGMEHVRLMVEEI